MGGIINEFFDTVFRPDNGQRIPTLQIPSVIMGILVFTSCLVHQELSPHDTSKSPGPDQMHFILVKWLVTFLAKPSEDLFYNSFATADVPGDWKTTVFCAIFRKVDPEDVAKYYAISMASVVCKVFIRILKRAMLSFLWERYAITG